MKPTTPSASPTGNPDKRDPLLVQKLKDYMLRHEMVNSPANRKKIATAMGSNPTFVYRYLANEFNGNLKSFQEQLASFLNNEVDRVTTNKTLITKDFIVESVWSFLRHCKAHGHIGVGYGEAGRGKTCAAKLYADQDKTAIYVHVNAWKGNHAGLVASIAKALKINAGRTLVDEAVVDRLSASGRLLILDNAHKLKESARSFIADFWEETRIPIALIGNPEILEQFRKCDQHGSRVGLRRDITADLEGNADASAAHLIKMHYPEAESIPEIKDEAASTLMEFGGCRSLVMRLKLAHEMLKGKKVEDPVRAFRLAKSQLITAA